MCACVRVCVPPSLFKVTYLALYTEWTSVKAIPRSSAKTLQYSTDKICKFACVSSTDAFLLLHITAIPSTLKINMVAHEQSMKAKK